MIELEKVFQEYKENLQQGLNSVPLKELKALTQHFIELSDQKKNLYIMGNGGSCATSAHFANDLHGISLKIPRFNLRAEALGMNSAIMSGLSNDYGFEHSYSKILEKKLHEGDSVFLISASGNSPNLVRAANMAKAKGARVLSLVGFDGGELKNLSDICVHIPSKTGEYEKSEDLHLIVNHFIRTYLTLALG